MASLLDEIQMTDGNAEAFGSIIAITQEHDGAEYLFIWGPPGSGKSTVVRARGRERDLLSSRRIIAAHAQEIRAAILSGVNDGFLDEVGSADVLLLDGFDSFFMNEEDEMGSEIARLLLTERNMRDLDTVLISDVPKEELASFDTEGILERYRSIEVRPLEGEDLRVFARNIEERFHESNDKAPRLSDEALNYIVFDFAQSIDDVRNAVTFLITKTEKEPGAVISKEEAAQLLGA